MRLKAKMTRLEYLLLVAACTGLSVGGQTVPPGAAALGYTSFVINDTPTSAEIAPGRNGNYKWFSGNWWQSPAPSITNFTTVSNALTLNFTGASLDLQDTPIDFSTGALPILPGSNGFYVEFDVQLSDNNQDHWACVWVQSRELGTGQDTYSPPDPVGFVRWMEFDIQESGWDTGLTGTVHNWTGTNGAHVTSLSNPNSADPTPLDMSQKHTFGGSYDPIHQQVAWWVDGIFQMSAGPPYVPAIGAQQHYFLIISAYSHGLNVPYTMRVSGVRAYVPSVMPAAPTDLHIVPP
jgi:hypothetical protein